MSLCTYHKVHIISIDDVRTKEIIPSALGTRDVSLRRLTWLLHQTLLRLDVTIPITQAK